MTVLGGSGITGSRLSGPDRGSSHLRLRLTHQRREKYDRHRYRLELARVAAQAAADKLAKDILLVDVSDRLAITDCS